MLLPSNPFPECFFGDSHEHFHDHARRCRVQGLALVRVTGADAVDFLHGQFTQKIRGLEGAVRACGYCSPKGRLLAVFRAFPMTDGAVGLLVPASIVEGFVKRLRMYVLRSKVTFEVAAASIAVATGEAGAAALAAAGLEAPQTGRTTRAGDAYLLGLTPAAAVEGFAAAGARTLLVSENTLSDKLPVVEETDDRTWRASEMAAGMPVVLAETLERFTPQAANLELAGGPSFSTRAATPARKSSRACSTWAKQSAAARSPFSTPPRRKRATPSTLKAAKRAP